MKKKNNVLFPRILLVLVICLSFVSVFLSFCSSSFADTEFYSGVLEDLQKDEAFDASQYPANDNDNSLQVLQIAESTAGELFIYVYQPSARARDLRASSIVISQTELPNDLQIYSLTFIDSSGTLYKYKVDNIQIQKDALRYYYITEIYRPFNADIGDKKPEDDTHINEIAYSVSRLYTAFSVDNTVVYSYTNTQDREIKDLTWGTIQYLNGYTFYQKSCDAHYVAFSTDIPIDKIIEADVSFVHTWHGYGSGQWVERDPVQDKVTVKSTDNGASVQQGIFGHTYEFPRIQSMSEFLSSLEKDKIELTDETKQKLDGKQWVFRYYETDYIWGSNITGAFYEYTSVDNVTVLRLMYEYNEQLYNVGIIANMGGDDGNPDNEQPPWWYWIVVAISVLVSVILVLVLVPQILSNMFGLTDVEWSVGGVIKLILKILLLAVMIVIIIAAIRSIIQGTIITDELFGLFGLDSPIDFY